VAARVLFGLTWGARGPAITAKTADLFPGRQLGTILGVITIGSGVGSAAGSWAAGWIFDLFRQLSARLHPSIIAYVCGCIAFWALRRPPCARGRTNTRSPSDGPQLAASPRVPQSRAGGHSWGALMSQENRRARPTATARQRAQSTQHCPHGKRSQPPC